jgi:hypothetical protein
MENDCMSPSRSLVAVTILLILLTCLSACVSPRPSGGDDSVGVMPAEAWFSITNAGTAGWAIDGHAVAASPVPARRHSELLFESPTHSAGEIVLLYIPNRIFDLLDIVRARVRVGPGFGISLRATQWAQYTGGTYSSLFLGIPGPRRQRIINWPAGVEKIEHAQGEPRPRDDAPRYGIGEIGLGLHVAIVGADVGVDPWEIVDFLAGLITMDPVEDDL